MITFAFLFRMDVLVVVGILDCTPVHGRVGDETGGDGCNRSSLVGDHTCEEEDSIHGDEDRVGEVGAFLDA